MKQFTTTRFFLLLKGNENDTSVLEQEYDYFAFLLLAEGNASANKVAYRNMLVYTRTELSDMARVSEKKCPDLCCKIH